MLGFQENQSFLHVMVGAINLHCMQLEMGGDRMAVSEGPLSGLICKIGELFSWQGISNYLQS